MDHVDGRRVVRLKYFSKLKYFSAAKYFQTYLVDQDGELVVRQRDVLHGGRGVAASTAVSSIGVGGLTLHYHYHFIIIIIILPLVAEGSE